MFHNQTPFYFATIRKLTGAFGALFDSISVVRRDKDDNSLYTVKVPIRYANTQKYVTMDKENRRVGNKVKYNSIKPRMSFELLDMQYDPTRKRNAYDKRRKYNSTDNDLITQLNPTPWDFSFSLNITVKNIDDGLQIIEQILPWFNQSQNLTVKDIPELDIISDVPVIFQSITTEDSFEGQYEEDRVITHTLTFVVKGYLFAPLKDSDVIRKVITNFYDNKSLEDPKTGKIIVAVDPIDAEEDDYDISTEILEGDDANE